MDVASLSHIDEFLAENLTETFYLTDDNPCLGKQIKDINLRAETEASIISIIRKEDTIFNPNGKEILKAQDTLVITGTHNAIDKAIRILNGE